MWLNSFRCEKFDNDASRKNQSTRNQHQPFACAVGFFQLQTADLQCREEAKAGRSEEALIQRQCIADHKGGGEEKCHGGHGHSRIVSKLFRAVADRFLHVEKSQTDYRGQKNQRRADLGEGGILRNAQSNAGGQSAEGNQIAKRVDLYAEQLFLFVSFAAGGNGAVKHIASAGKQ